MQLRQELGLEGDDLEEPILHSLTLLFHEWAVNRGDVDDARALQKALESYYYPGLADHDQLYVDIKMQKCLFHYRARNWEKAKEIAKKLVETCKAKNMVKNHARILIQMAICELESDSKQCTAALAPLLEAIAMCERWEMHGLHAAGMSILAVIFMRLQNPRRAIAILEAALPSLLQREHVLFQASAYLTLSKAHMKIAATTNRSGPLRGNGSSSTAPKVSGQPLVSPAVRKRLHRALQALNRSVELFEQCQDCYGLRESLYLQAQLHSSLANLTEREASSERFLIVCQHLGNSTDLSSTHLRTGILNAIGDPAMLQGLVQRSI
jgi:tetratricopeptide (TPR) repeat protein